MNGATYVFLRNRREICDSLVGHLLHQVRDEDVTDGFIHQAVTQSHRTHHLSTGQDRSQVTGQVCPEAPNVLPNLKHTHITYCHLYHQMNKYKDDDYLDASIFFLLVNPQQRCFQVKIKNQSKQVKPKGSWVGCTKRKFGH